MRTAAVAVLAFLMLLPALPAQAQVGYHAGVAMDLWDRDAGYEEAYFLGGLSWTPGGWEYRASAAALVRQSDSSLKIGGEAAASRLFFRGSRLEPLLGVGATIYQTDTMPFDEPGISLAPLLIVGTKLNMASGISLRLEYRGVYGIFPSSFAGISVCSRVLVYRR